MSEEKEAGDIRLGHALGLRHKGHDEEALKQAIKIAQGREKLLPRPPTDQKAVQHAEKILNKQSDHSSDDRPIYAYIGDLHPDLGCVGLIFSRDWGRREFEGGSRCDSGGLAEGHGHFCGVIRSKRDAALCAISSPVSFDHATWEVAFAEEIKASYANGSSGYIDGDVPNTKTWPHGDVRKELVPKLQASPPDGGLDRRLWTWELRMKDSPYQKELIAIVTSYEAFKWLKVSRRVVGELPESIYILHAEDRMGMPGSWFHTPRVRSILLGGGEL